MAVKLKPTKPERKLQIKFDAGLKYEVFHHHRHLLLILSWRDSPLVGLGLLHIHEEFCGF